MRDLTSESLRTILRNPKADLYGREKSNMHRSYKCAEGRQAGLVVNRNTVAGRERRRRRRRVGPTSPRSQADDGEATGIARM